MALVSENFYNRLKTFQYWLEPTRTLQCVLTLDKWFLYRVYVKLLWLHHNYVIMGAIASLITSLTIVYSTVYSDADQRKHQSSASLAFVRGIHRWPVNSLHKWPVTRKMFPFDDVIMEYLWWCCAQWRVLIRDVINKLAPHARVLFMSIYDGDIMTLDGCRVLAPSIIICYTQATCRGYNANRLHAFDTCLLQQADINSMRT